MRKKGKGEKKPDKRPEVQLPKGYGVPAFVAAEGNAAQLKDTQQLGKELFESFSKNPAGIWIAKTTAGVEIKELSDSPPPLMSSDSESDYETEDEEYSEYEQHDPTTHNIACVATSMGTWAPLHLL
eukprot:217090-Rhodomonas_salina.1